MMPDFGLGLSPMELGVALVLGACVLLFTYALVPAGDGTPRRVRERAQRLRQREPGHETKSEATAKVRRQTPKSASGKLGVRLGNLLPNAEAIRAKLDKAGVPVDVADFFMICVAFGAMAFAFSSFVLELPVFVDVAIGLIAMVWLPKKWLNGRIARRTKKFLTQFPDAIDLMVRGLKSGLPISETLKAIGEEMADPIGPIFQTMSHNLQVGMTLDDALWSVVQKLQIQEFKFFVISLVIQQETGGNLAEILHNLSHMIRRRHQLKMKIKAMSSEARASAMIIGALPFVMALIIYFVNRDYIMILFTDPRGYLLLAMGGASMLTGILVISKMIRFDI